MDTAKAEGTTVEIPEHAKRHKKASKWDSLLAELQAIPDGQGKEFDPPLLRADNIALHAIAARRGLKLHVSNREGKSYVWIGEKRKKGE